MKHKSSRLNKNLGLGLTWACCAVTSAIVLLGCGGGPVSTYYVTGTVKLPDDTSLNGGRILFRPAEGQHSARGDIQEDGTFTLTTFESADGAVAGTHTVTITPALPEGFMDEPAARVGYRSPIDQRYQSLKTSPLEYTVSSDDSNHFDIIVEPPSPRRGRKR